MRWYWILVFTGWQNILKMQLCPCFHPLHLLKCETPSGYSGPIKNGLPLGRSIIKLRLITPLGTWAAHLSGQPWCSFQGKKIDNCDSWSQELNVRWIPCPLMFLFCYNTAHQITLNIIRSNNCDSFTDTAEPMISHPNHLSGTQSVFHVSMVRRSSPLITGKKQLVLFFTLVFIPGPGLSYFIFILHYWRFIQSEYPVLL